MEGLENNDVGQRWEKNIVEHKGIGVMIHDEVDDDDTLGYDDQDDDVGGGQDWEDNEEYAAEGDQEHEDHDEHAWESGYAEWNAEEDECDEGGTATARTMMTICGQQTCGESAACMPGNLAEGGVEDEARDVSIPHPHHLHAARTSFSVSDSLQVYHPLTQIQCALVHCTNASALAQG